jgi:2-polyprenyl-6-methoxyphenol hydroxylase-like FAD-dependent oxidoreductase
MQYNNQKASIVIIGCGPAGAAASLFLSKAGIHHTILERDIFPRDKVCGDGCSGKTAFVLRKANPAFLDEIFSSADKFLPNFGVLFAAPNGKSIEIPYGNDLDKLKHPPGFTTKRMVFDHFLFEKIQSPYAHIEQNAAVQKLERSENGYTVTYTKEQQSYQIAATLVIGADGDKGVSRKQLLQHNIVSKTACIGLRAYYKGVSGMQERNLLNCIS